MKYRICQDAGKSYFYAEIFTEDKWRYLNNSALEGKSIESVRKFLAELNKLPSEKIIHEEGEI